MFVQGYNISSTLFQDNRSAIVLKIAGALWVSKVVHLTCGFPQLKTAWRKQIWKFYIARLKWWLGISSRSPYKNPSFNTSEIWSFGVKNNYPCVIVVRMYTGVSRVLGGHEGSGFLNFFGCNFVCLIFFWHSHSMLWRCSFAKESDTRRVQ